MPFKHNQSTSRLSLQISKEVPTKLTTAIVETKLLVNFLNLLHIFWAQLEVTSQVGPDPQGRFRLRQHRVALRDSPSYQITLQSASCKLNSGRSHLPRVTWAGVLL